MEVRTSGRGFHVSGWVNDPHFVVIFLSKWCNFTASLPAGCQTGSLKTALSSECFLWPPFWTQFSPFPQFVIGSPFPEDMTVALLCSLSPKLFWPNEFTVINSMSMNEFLSLWLKDAASVCANEDWSSRSDEECCILLGQTLLNVPEGSLTDVAQA